MRVKQTSDCSVESHPRLCSFYPRHLGPAHRDSGKPGYASATRWPRTQSKHERAGASGGEEGRAWVGGRDGPGGKEGRAGEARREGPGAQVGWLGGQKGPYLHHAADDLGQHVQREPENVEERQRHEGLLSV